MIYINLVVQAAVYGIGVCAEFGGAKFQPVVGGTRYQIGILKYAKSLNSTYWGCLPVGVQRP